MLFSWEINLWVLDPVPPLGVRVKLLPFQDFPSFCFSLATWRPGGFALKALTLPLPWRLECHEKERPPSRVGAEAFLSRLRAFFQIAIKVTTADQGPGPLVKTPRKRKV